MESGSTPPAVPLLGATMEDALDAGLRKAGVFCSLCGRSAPTPPEPPKLGELKEGEAVMWMDGGPPTMTEYLVIAGEIDPQPGTKPTVTLTRFYHCGRDDCDASAVRSRAQAVRRVPAWELLAAEEETFRLPMEEPEDADPPIFKRGDPVLLTVRGIAKVLIVTGWSYFDAADGGPEGWRYSLSPDGSPEHDLPEGPFPEADLSAVGGSA